MGPTVGVHGGSVLPTTPRHPRADSPVYVGWVQVVPESKEKYTPDVPTSGVNGHVLSSPALHASRSTHPRNRQARRRNGAQPRVDRPDRGACIPIDSAARQAPEELGST